MMARCEKPLPSRLCRALSRKLSSTAGDTLVEILTALLISVMAVTLMATMVMTATNVTSKNDTRMAALFEAQSSLSVPSKKDLVSSAAPATISGGSIDSISIKVDIYGDDAFLRYELFDNGMMGGR